MNPTVIPCENLHAEQIEKNNVVTLKFCSNILSTFERIGQIVDLHVQAFPLLYAFLLRVGNFTIQIRLMDLFPSIQDDFLADRVA